MVKLKNLFKGDRAIWVVYFFLCIISLVEVYSAASTLAYKDGSFLMPLLKQAVFLVVGCVCAVVVHRIPCRKFKVLPVFLGLPLLFLVAFTTLYGSMTNGAARWVGYGIFQFQPSELAKGIVIIAEALILARMQREKGADPKAFKYILIVTLAFDIFILPENLSTALLLFGVSFVMMWVGRVPYLQLGKLMGVCGILAMVGLFTLLNLPDDQKSGIYDVPGLHRVYTWKQRIDRHSSDVVPPDSFDLDKNAQRAHANIAIASCNVVGKMPGNSVERDFLSQAFSDFIYAIIIEEMGLWGAVLVVFLYVVLLFRAGRIAGRCERSFPAFLAMGLALLLVSQAVLNMLVAVGIFPVTGQTLPLISRGGTSTIVNSIYIGMILSVSRYARKTREPVDSLIVPPASAAGGAPADKAEPTAVVPAAKDLPAAPQAED